MEAITDIIFLRFLINCLLWGAGLLGIGILFFAKVWLNERRTHENFVYDEFRKIKSERDELETRIAIIEKVCNERHH